MDKRPDLVKPAAKGFPRDLAMDGLRTVAILLMMASHTTRLIDKEERRFWSEFAMLIEPLTASLFLLLVGAALVRSWEVRGASGRGEWLKRSARRAALLWAISCAFFVLEHGFHFPDALVSSGILATIAFALILFSLPISSKHSAVYLSAMAAAGTALFIYLDAAQMRVFLLTSGNSPWLPLLLFTAIGALAARWVRARQDGAVKGLAVLGLALVSGSLYLHGFEEFFSKPLGRYGYVREMAGGLWGEPKSVSYYNLRPALLPMITGICALMYSGFFGCRNLLARMEKFALALGRKSLQVYVLHLFLLALLVVLWGPRPLGQAWQGDAALAALIAVCTGWVFLQERRSSRR